MHLVISDSFADVTEIQIKKTGDAIYIDVPRKRNGVMIVHIIKLLITFLIK